MKAQIGASILAMAAAAALGACASKGPVSSVAQGVDAQDALAAEYQSLIDNAINPVVCRREAVTGSRLQTREVCLTQAQIDAQREHAVDVLNNTRPRIDPMPRPMSDRSNGVPRP